VNGFTHAGCYAEGTTGRALTYGVSGATIPAAQMTVDRCTAACLATNFLLAGVEYGSECYCANTISNGGAPATGCEMRCNGNSSEYCGAGNRLNVYTRGQLPSATSSTVVATATSSVSGTGPQPTGPSQPPVVDDFEWYGCRTEGTGTRALSGATFASDNMTLESCQEFCSAFVYFGVEYGSECYCVRTPPSPPK